MSDPIQPNTPNQNPYGSPNPEETHVYPQNPGFGGAPNAAGEQPTQAFPTYPNPGQNAGNYGQPAQPEQPTQAFPYGQPERPTQSSENPYQQQPNDMSTQLPQNGYNPNAGVNTGNPYVPGSQPPATYPPQEPYGQAPQSDKWNTLTIVGFILSFFFGFIGSIVSGIGLSQVKKTGEKSKGLAIAGIVIGIVATLASIGLTIAMLVGAANVAEQWRDEANGSTHSQITPKHDLDNDDTFGGNDSDSDDYLKDNDSDDLLDDDLTDDLTDKDLKGLTLEQLFNMPQVQKELQEQQEEMPDGLKMNFVAKGNTVICNITITDEDMESMVSESFGDSLMNMLKPSFKELCDEVGVKDGKIQVVIDNASGKQLYSNTASIE